LRKGVDPTNLTGKQALEFEAAARAREEQRLAQTEARQAITNTREPGSRRIVQPENPNVLRTPIADPIQDAPSREENIARYRALGAQMTDRTRYMPTHEVQDAVAERVALGRKIGENNPAYRIPEPPTIGINAQTDATLPPGRTGYLDSSPGAATFEEQWANLTPEAKSAALLDPKFAPTARTLATMDERYAAQGIEPPKRSPFLDTQRGYVGLPEAVGLVGEALLNTTPEQAAESARARGGFTEFGANTGLAINRGATSLAQAGGRFIGENVYPPLAYVGQSVSNYGAGGEFAPDSDNPARYLPELMKDESGRPKRPAGAAEANAELAAAETGGVRRNVAREAEVGAGGRGRDYTELDENFVGPVPDTNLTNDISGLRREGINPYSPEADLALQDRQGNGASRNLAGLRKSIAGSPTGAVNLGDRGVAGGPDIFASIGEEEEVAFTGAGRRAGDYTRPQHETIGTGNFLSEGIGVPGGNFLGGGGSLIHDSPTQFSNRGATQRRDQANPFTIRRGRSSLPQLREYLGGGKNFGGGAGEGAAITRQINAARKKAQRAYDEAISEGKTENVARAAADAQLVGIDQLVAQGRNIVGLDRNQVGREGIAADQEFRAARLQMDAQLAQAELAGKGMEFFRDEYLPLLATVRNPDTGEQEVDSQLHARLIDLTSGMTDTRVARDVASMEKVIFEINEQLGGVQINDITELFDITADGGLSFEAGTFNDVLKTPGYTARDWLADFLPFGATGDVLVGSKNGEEVRVAAGDLQRMGLTPAVLQTLFGDSARHARGNQ
jgi:hypothetical protein